MKTAVSIPDNVFRRAEKLAKKRKISRSKLFTEAIESYLNEHDEDEITRKLNDVYSKEDSSLDPFWKELQSRALPREEW